MRRMQSGGGQGGIFSFAKRFVKSKYYKPMVAVPSTYSKIYEKDLAKNGFRIVIYANHLLRAAYPAMVEVAKKILVNQRSFDVEKKISSIDEVINLIDTISGNSKLVVSLQESRINVLTTSLLHLSAKKNETLELIV